MADPALALVLAAFVLVPVGIVLARRRLARGRAVMVVSALVATVAVVLFVLPPRG